MKSSLGSRFRSSLKKLFSNPLILNVAIVGSMALAIKVVSFYKETLIASTFGLSLMLDTFLIAILIPGFIQNVFIGALRNIFIPNYITEISTTNERGSFQALVFCIVTAIMLFFAVLTYLLSDFFVEMVFPGKDVEFYSLVREQLYIVLPSLFFMGFSSIVSGLLEIGKKFFLSTLAGVFPAITTIIALLFFKEVLGNKVLAIGFLIGTIMSLIYYIIVCFRVQVISLKRPKLNANSKLMLRQLPAKVTSGFLTGINPFVDQYFAAQLAIGSISALSYGVKIPSFVAGITIIAIGNVVLPHFAKMINENRRMAFHHLFKMLKTIFIVVAIAATALIVFSQPIVSLLFERKEFTADDTAIVALVMQILLVYLPFKICSITMVKFLTSINENKFMAYTSIFSLTTNLVMNFVLIQYYGLYGLALSTTIVQISVTTIFFIYIKSLYRNFGYSNK